MKHIITIDDERSEFAQSLLKLAMINAEADPDIIVWEVQNNLPEKSKHIEKIEKLFIENPELVKEYALQELIRRRETLKRKSSIPLDF